MDDFGVLAEEDEISKKPIEVTAVDALGLGYDITFDFRLKYAKKGIGVGESERLVVLDEINKRDILIPGSGGGGGVMLRGISGDIRCDKGEQMRFQSDVLQFNQMSELVNQKSSVDGKVPSGYFNAIFNLGGTWLNDAADTKYLAFDGYFFSQYYVHLTTSALVLNDKVKRSVPSHWDPEALSRFIQNYGTHVIVGMAIGGQDLVCVRQGHSSGFPPAELRANLEDLGDALFSDGKVVQRKSTDGKQKVPDVFNRVLRSNIIQLSSIVESSSKDGLTVIRSRRGGNVYLHNHSQWLQTVPSNPDAILFKFVPITSLLTGVPGSGYLSHAINLYVRYKPIPEDLQYFLEFQVPRQWAPMYNELPLQHLRLAASCPSLQFSFLGPKIHVNSAQVSSCQKPIVGLRIYLEGRRCNQLAIHAQHLTTLPNSMALSLGGHSQWRGSDEFESRDQFLEPVNWKSFSNVCTSMVKYDPNWSEGKSGGVFIVTGAQLLTKGRWPKTVLHLRLLYTHLQNCTIRKKDWAAAPESSRKSSILMTLSTTLMFSQRANTGPPKQLPAALNSGVYPNGPPMPLSSAKLLRYVNTAEMVRGPHDTPGHWLVIGARLAKEGGKIGLHVKFALIDYNNEV